MPQPPGGFYGIIGMMGRGEQISLSPPVVTRKVEFDQLWEVNTPLTLQHTTEGLCLYTGAGNFTHDSIGTVRAKHSVDLSGPLAARSFELQIIEPGQHKYIGIGVVCKTYPPDKLPGWKEISVGYHADNGDLFHSCEEGKPTEQPCMKGDLMRCTVEAIDKGKEVLVLFHRNGEQVGRITSWKPEEGFYFCFGMMSRDEKVQVILPEISEPYSPEEKAPPLEESWMLNPNMQHEGGGVCHFVKSDHDEGVGTTRSKSPLDPFGPNNYFDVKIIDPGEKGFIALGVCSEHYPTHRLPGWDELSVGFHADDGSIQTSSDQKSTGVACRRGDVIRCSIVPIDKHDKQVNVTFHKNGESIGKMFFWKPPDGRGFFAQVGCMSEGEVIQVASHSTSPSSLSPSARKVTSPTKYEYHPLQSPTSAGQSLLTQQPSLTDTSLPSDRKVMTSLLTKGHEEYSPGPAAMATGGAEGASVNPFFPPHMPHPPHRVPPPFPPFPGPRHHNPHDFHLYHKWMQLYQSQYYNPHSGYHGYPLPESSEREGTKLTPEAKADTSSPWRFPYPFPPFMDPRGPPPHGGFPSDRPSPPAGPEMARQMTQLYDYAKQVSTASYASDAAPFGVSRENSSEATPAIIGTSRDSHTQGSTRTPASSSDVGVSEVVTAPVASHQLTSEPSFNEATGNDKLSPLVRYDSQTSNTSSSSQHLSDTSEPLQSTESCNDATLAPSVQSKLRQEKLLLKQLPLASGKFDPPTSTPKGGASSVNSSHGGDQCHSDEYVDSPLTPVSTLDSSRTSEAGQSTLRSVAGGDNGASNSNTADDLTPTNSTVPLQDNPEESEDFSPSQQIPTDFIPTKFCLQQQRSVDFVPKEDNKMFQLLHNVDTNDDGSFVRTVPDDHNQVGNSFIMSRLPLSEKMPFFEVEIHKVSDSALPTLAIGLVWENYPVFHLPGKLPGSIGLHGDGSLIAASCTSGESLCQPITSVLESGDVVGCQAQLHYKSEVRDSSENKDGNVVKIEFFKNGLSLTVHDIILPPNGLHPAVGFKGHGTCLRLNQNIRLTPKSYFDTHPLPQNFVNFTAPTAESTGWKSLKNATVSADSKLSINEPHSGVPAVVQHSLPFSANNFYFEVELCCHVSALSVLAIGALPQKSLSESSTLIPGEAASSIGFLPLIGFIMRAGGILSAIPETITSSLHEDKTTIGVGIDCRKEVRDLDTSMPGGDLASEDRVMVFFTINGQVINSMFATLPEGGFFPTLAVDSDCKADVAIAVRFPHLWPKVDRLPFGFVRGAENGFVLQDDITVLDVKGTESSNVTALPVRALQAAVPLSPANSYFQIRILRGGETYRISIGLASYSYDLSKHPGWRNESIAFHADDGNLFIDGIPELVAPACHFKGTVLGCGAKFPEDGNVRFAEVYFTINNRLVARRFVRVPHLGFFPTVGMRTKGGVVTIDLNATDPFPDMKFNTVWGTTDNVKIEGNIVTIASSLQRVKRGAALLCLPLSPRQLVYFKAIALSEITGNVMFGITTSKQCPHDFCESQPFKSCMINLNNGQITIYDKYFQSKDSCACKDSRHFGCGLQPLPDGKKFILFFTCDEQVIFCSPIELDSDEVYPIVLLMETTTRIKLDACALWPNMTPIGPGWARFANLKLENSNLSHSSTTLLGPRKKLAVGFAQAATPLTPSNPYFEIEVISRAINKAIAIGVASRKYPTNSYVGWHDESIGYHLDDGKVFKAFKHGHSFGPKAYATDTIGCGIRFDKVCHAAALKGGDNLEVFFTINGAVLGTQKMTIPSGGAFPTICLESPTESVIYHHHSEIFPPVTKIVDSRIWGNAYAVCQADRQILHCSRQSTGSLAKAFCQAKKPFSPDNSYFEIEIIGMESNSVIQMGPSTLIPRGCTSPNTYSFLYSSAGQLITRKSDQKVIFGTQKSGLGDRIGCALLYDGSKPTAVEFYVNYLKISKRSLGSCQSARLQNSDLYPTIVLTHPGDVVIPSLNIPPPTADSPFLLGWLRMERVKVKSALVEYTAAGKTIVDVGVAQASQALNFNSITYYEIEILNRGQRCTISIGLASSDYSLNNQPGWRENSVAVHGDDGRLFQNSGLGTAFGPAWKKYDVIGLGIRSPTNNCLPYSMVQVYFTRNGEEIGHTSQMVPPSGLFPTIGMHSVGEKVKVHMGTKEATPTNYDPIRLEWQALCGIDLSKSSEGSHILSYKDCGRCSPHNLERGLILSVAVGHRPFSDEMNYFEVEILSKGRTGIAIGAVPTNFPLQEAPGWSHDSVAYHTDDGLLYHSALKGKDFGPVPHVGDLIGCGVELMPNNTKFCFVFFTFNGFIIGRVRASLPEKGFHPGLALTTEQDKIAVRFMESFKPKVPILDSSFIGVMRINNCSYSHQIVQFSGNGNSGYTQAPAMAQFAVPLHNDRRYFAANIVRCKDVILIGLAVKDYPMKYAPGSTSISIAYNTSRGNIKAVYGPDNFLHVDAPVCKVGDTVGCGISLNETASKNDPPGSIYFTKNNILVKSVALIELLEDLYPVVGFIPEQKSSAVFMDWNMPLFQPFNKF